MAYRLLKESDAPDASMWTAHERQSHSWTDETRRIGAEWSQWYGSAPVSDYGQTSDVLAPEVLDVLIEDVRTLAERLEHAQKTLDSVLPQLRHNREAIDKEKAEIAQLKRDLGLVRG